MPTEEISLEQAHRQADAIIQSDLVSRRTCAAILKAMEYAQGRQISLEHCRRAVRDHRAKLRLVAAAFGFVRCGTCGEFIHISTTVDPDDFDQCPHVLDIDSDEMEAVLVVYAIFGGRIVSSFSLHSAFADRQRIRPPNQSS